MADASHTPGPWHDDGYRIYAPTDSADPRDGRVIIEYKHVAEFNPADAPMLTAGPEMLAALRGARDAIDGMFARMIVLDAEFLPSRSRYWPALLKINDAIFAATRRPL